MKGVIETQEKDHIEKINQNNEVITRLFKNVENEDKKNKELKILN